VIEVAVSDILVIGYGNLLSGDDGAGHVVAGVVEQWRVPRVKVLILHQLTPELAEDLARAVTVFFVDACVDVTLVQPVLQEMQATEDVVSSSHHSSPTELLALTKHLYGCAPQAYLIKLPAESFELSEGLSTKAQKGVREVLEYFHEALNGPQVANQHSVSEKLLHHL
jgi:hydrogenase maturation protease